MSSETNELEEAQKKSREKVDQIRRTYPGVLDALYAQMVKIRLDYVTEFLVEELQARSVEGYNVAEKLNLGWEQAWLNVLEQVEKEAAKQKLSLIQP